MIIKSVIFVINRFGIKMEYSEKTLVGQLISGNENAYKYIYDHHYVFLCRLANKYLNDPFLAETIVGDVIFHLWEIRSSLDINISLRYYLIKAVRNRCINFLRSEYENKEMNFSLLGSEEVLDNYAKAFNSHPLDTLLEHELEHEINSTINKLPRECRRVFIKSRFENKNYEEIAQELCISINTVKYHIKNALAFIRKDLDNYLIFFIFFSFIKNIHF